MPLTLPWITGNPYSLYARVRANVGGDTTNWSTRYGFTMKSPAPPASLSNGANTTPGMIRWTPVTGATAYEVSFLWDLPNGQNKKIKTATTAADLRELYAFANDLGAQGLTNVSWRVRALRELEGDPLNNLPVVSYGPWSPTNVTVEPRRRSPPRRSCSQQSISRSRTTDIFDVLGAQSPDAHELFPGFWWSGQFALDGTSGACPTLVAATGVTCPLFRVYVFTDEDCVNRVHSGDIVGSPAYVPRLSGVMSLPKSPAELSTAPAVFLGDAATEGDTFDAGGAKVMAAGTQPGIPADPSDADVPEGSTADRKSGIWDNDWPESRYYWTAVPVIPVITADARVEYRDVEFAEDMCQAGNVIDFGKTSAPVIERASGVPYVSGMGGDGQHPRGPEQHAVVLRPPRDRLAARSRRGPLPGPVEQEGEPVQGGRHRDHARHFRAGQSRRGRLVLPRPRRRQDAADEGARHDLDGSAVRQGAAEDLHGREEPPSLSRTVRSALTRVAGSDSSPAKTRSTISRLSAPTRNATVGAAFSTG